MLACVPRTSPSRAVSDRATECLREPRGERSATASGSPVRCSAIASSSRRSSSTVRAPSSPPAARPQIGIRPASTARAPSASAIATSVPRRMPPSRSTSSRSPTASTIGGQRLERRQRRRRAGGRRGSRRRPGRPVLRREHRVLRVEDTLDDDRAPARTRRKLARGRPSRAPGRAASSAVARAAAVERVAGRRAATSSGNVQWIRRSRSRGPDDRAGRR